MEADTGSVVVGTTLSSSLPQPHPRRVLSVSLKPSVSDSSLWGWQSTELALRNFFLLDMGSPPLKSRHFKFFWSFPLKEPEGEIWG